MQVYWVWNGVGDRWKPEESSWCLCCNSCWCNSVWRPPTINPIRMPTIPPVPLKILLLPLTFLYCFYHSPRVSRSTNTSSDNKSESNYWEAKHTKWCVLPGTLCEKLTYPPYKYIWCTFPLCAFLHDTESLNFVLTVKVKTSMGHLYIQPWIIWWFLIITWTYRWHGLDSKRMLHGNQQLLCHRISFMSLKMEQAMRKLLMILDMASRAIQS